MTIIKSTYGLLQSAHCCFNEYIKTITLKVGLNICKNDPCILYILNELGTEIVIVYVYDILEIGYKPAFMDMIECIKKENLTQSTGPLEDFVGCTIKCDFTNMTPKISQPHIITKMTQVFN